MAGTGAGLPSAGGRAAAPDLPAQAAQLRGPGSPDPAGAPGGGFGARGGALRSEPLQDVAAGGRAPAAATGLAGASLQHAAPEAATDLLADRARGCHPVPEHSIQGLDDRGG